MKPPSGLMNSGNKKMARGKRRLVSRLIRGRHSRSRTTILLCLNLRWQLYQYCYSSFCLTYTNKGIYTDPVARPWAHPRQHPWPWPLVCPFSGFRLTVGDVHERPLLDIQLRTGEVEWLYMPRLKCIVQVALLSRTILFRFRIQFLKLCCINR